LAPVGDVGAGGGADHHRIRRFVEVKVGHGYRPPVDDRSARYSSQTTFSLSFVPQTMLPSSSPVPQTMFPSSSSMPQTMLPSSSVPPTMLPSSSPVPQTMLPSSSDARQMMLSQSPFVHGRPQTTLLPASPCVFAQPHSTPGIHALAAG